MSRNGQDWRAWDVDDWNRALFCRYFSNDGDIDQPVNRIPVTKEELVEVVLDPHSDSQDIHDAFLEVVKARSYTAYNRRLSSYPIDPYTGWNQPVIPAFFIELAFSCFVASPPDGEIRNNGDFRNRLALLLGHDRKLSNYPLETLAPLWRALSSWLDWRRSLGESYKRLELPPLDHRVRIGYSINLAFPSRKDQMILARLFTGQGFEADPPIPTVFSLVGKEIQRFSRSFNRAYEEFRRAFIDKEKDLERYSFWGAIRSAVTCASEEDIDGCEDDRRRLKLVMEPGGIVLLLSTAPSDVRKGVLSFVEADSPYGDYENILCLNTGSSFDFNMATKRLLGGRYQDILSGKGWRSINLAIEQGVLLFAKTESFSWELIVTRHEEGDMRALVMDFLVTDFLDFFPNDCRPYSKSSVYAGWTELELFPAEWMRCLDFSSHDVLGAARCLQPTVVGHRLSLIGGCPVDGGFLGFPTFLPTVRAPFTDAVQVIPCNGETTQNVISLVKKNEDLDEYWFPDDLQKPLQGSYRVVGSFNGRVLAQKELVFRSEIVVNDYAQPTDPNAWTIEGGGPEIVSYIDVSDDAPCHLPSEISKTKQRTDLSVCSASSALIDQLKSSGKKWISVKANLSETQSRDKTTQDLKNVDHFMEICGGLAMRRRGIPEPDMLTLIRDCLSVEDYSLQWDVARAWTESGYFDRLHYKKWRRTDYFPQAPRFVLEECGSLIRGVLFGLATVSFRSRVDVELTEMGAKRVKSDFCSTWIVPMPAWEVSSVEPFISLSSILDLAAPVWKPPVSNLLWPLHEIVSPRESPPEYFDLFACWDWGRGMFSQKMEPSETGVSVSLFSRPDRQSYYQITVDGEHVWWSSSRNWSLILAYELKGDSLFALAGDDQVVRACKGQVYLPLSVGRYLSMSGVTTPRPSEGHDGGYIYHFQNSKERQLLLSLIWEQPHLKLTEIRRWAHWALTVSRRSNMKRGLRVLPLPESTRRRLEPFHEYPEIRELSRAKFEPALQVLVKENLSRFLQLKGK